MMPGRVLLPAVLARQIEQAALAAAPRECCGLLVGRVEGNAVAVLALAPARNLAPAADRFEIDPADHFAALRQARQSGHAIIGCYHSHPNGMAQPSAEDARGAGEDGFVWLIAALRNGQAVITAHVYEGGSFVGADLVTSSS